MHFSRSARLFSQSFLCSHCFHFLECLSSCTLIPVGHCLMSLPPLPGGPCFFYASIEYGTIECLLLYLSIWLSSSVGLSSSKGWVSFSCILWCLIPHQYILGQSLGNSFCKGIGNKYFRYLDIFVCHMVSVTTTQLGCYWHKSGHRHYVHE